MIRHIADCPDEASSKLEHETVICKNTQKIPKYIAPNKIAKVFSNINLTYPRFDTDTDGD